MKQFGLFFVGLSFGITSAANAQNIYFRNLQDTSYNLSTVISQAQASNIVNSLLSTAPSGTKVSNISLKGSFNLDSQNYLGEVNLTEINFTVVAYSIIKDNISVKLDASFPDGNCNNPVILSESESGSSSLIDPKLSTYLKEHAVEIVKNNLINQSDLLSYCHVKPSAIYPVTFY